MATKTFYGGVTETNSLYGNNPADKSTYFEWLIFQDALGQPTTPTGGSWNFDTNTGTAPTGWLNSPPSSVNYLLWVSVAVVDSRNPTVLTWSSPGLMASPSGGASGVAVSASGSLQNNGTVSFANSNGVTFGLSNGVMTASVAPSAAAGVGIQGSGTVVQTSGTVQFANSNGVTFGLTNGSMTASVGTDYIAGNQTSNLQYTSNTSNITSNALNVSQSSLFQQVSNTSNITSNAFPSANTTKFAGTGTTFAGTNATATLNVNSAGVALSLSAGGGGGGGGIAAAAGTQTANTGTVAFVNSNGISFGMSNSSQITASYTVPTQSAQTQASGNIAGAGFTSTTTAGTAVVATHNSAGLSMGIPAYLTTAAQSTHSHNFATTTTNGSNIVVGTTNSAGATIGVPAFITTYAAQTNQTVASGNIAGVGTTFAGTNVSGSITLNSAGLNLALSAPAGGGGGGGVNIAAGTQTAGTGTVNFANSNNITFGMSGSNQITASFSQTVQTQASGNIVGSGFTSTTTAGTAVVATHNSAGLSMGIPAYLTTAAQSNHSHNFATTTTGGSNIVVGTTNSAGATIGVPAFITTYAAQTNQTVASGNIAGVGTTFAGTNATATLGVNSAGVALSLSVAGGGVINQTGPNIAVAGSTITSGDVLFSNANGVTFGMAGNTITASAAGGGGGGATIPYYEPYALGNNTSIFVFGQNTLYMQPLIAPDNVIVSNVELQVSIATSTTAAASNNVARTIKYGLYEHGTGASSGSLTLLGSSSMYINIYCDSNVSAGYTISQGTGSFTTTSAGTAVNSVLSGQKYMYFPFSTTLNAGGNYQWVMHMSTASTLSSHANRTFGMVILTNQTATTWGKLKTNGASISANSFLEEFDGRVYTATSSGLPSVFAESNCSVMNSKGRLYLKFENE